MMSLRGPSIKDNNVYRIAVLSLLAAVCIVSRVYLTFIPNVKPVTSILIIVAVVYGAKFGVELAILVTLLSNLLLGMGPWTIFQIWAWVLIVFIAGMLGKVKLGHNPWFMAVVAGLSGYLFGFLISLEKLLYGWEVFVAYYLSGLVFDTLHAVGNVLFYPICWFALVKFLKK